MTIAIPCNVRVLCATLFALGAANPALAQGGVPTRDVGAISIGAFEQFRDASTTEAGEQGRPLNFTENNVALPVDFPVLGYKQSDIASSRQKLGFTAAPRFNDVFYAYDATGDWYSQSFDTEFGSVLVEGHRKEIATNAPIFGGRMRSVIGAPATIDNPDIVFGGDDYSVRADNTQKPTEVTASFELSDLNYRVTLSCDPEGPFTDACGDETAIRSLLSDIKMLDEGQRR